MPSLMAGYADAGRIDDAYKVLEQIRSTKGLRPGMDTYNVLIHALSRCACTQDAE
jgi:pentatricopeptide repeat protein